jgi:uncharacterized membrane protein YuzA (DUF378 family)
MTWLADYISLLLIIGSALLLGGVAIFHVNAIDFYLGNNAQFVFGVCGLAGLWQAYRQKYF